MLVAVAARITRLRANASPVPIELAMTRKKHVTIVHKVNVLKIGDGMFIEECHKVGKEFLEVRVTI